MPPRPPRKNVLLVQLPIPPAGHEPVRGNIPLAAGYLKLAAQGRGLQAAHDIEVLPAPLASTLGDQALVEALIERRPDVLGFTCYMWSIDRVLWLAERVRERSPGTRIVLGGPEVSLDNTWVLESGAFDAAVVGEGEATFVEYLAALEAEPRAVERIAGLARRVDGQLRHAGPRAPMASLDPISSPYLAGILDARESGEMLLETVRGCIFRCKFCYYPKAYDGLYFLSREKILANLASAREAGASEVYILDPTLNQRRDFLEFLEVLKAGNPDRALRLHGELRAEGIDARHARAMREAGFHEVEAGLQSIEPRAQELMDRRNSLKAFEKGVRALQAEGIRTRVDLIVGLPGDTPDTVRRGMEYLARNRLYDDIQVFQLSVLPGTAFREEAARLGLVHQPRPPYYVLETPTFTLDDIRTLLAEAEDVFETEFDAPPPPALDLEPGAGAHRESPARIWLADLDASPAGRSRPPDLVAHAFTLWFRARAPYRHIAAMESALREVLSRNPFTALEVVIETEEDFPFDVFRRLRAACERAVNLYIDRFHEFGPGPRARASRLVVVFPEPARAGIPGDWVRDAAEYAEVAWRPAGARAPAT